MDLVIPLLAHSDDDFLDLRYAFRGYEKFMQPDRVILVGAKPIWCRNVEHIPALDNPSNDRREENIFRKLLLAPSEEFIYGNDDHFLLQPWAEEYAFDSSILSKYHSLPSSSHYKKTVANTLRIAPRVNNFDVHCPMTMRKSILQKLIPLPWHMPYGFCLKSAYAQAAGIKGAEYFDLKIRAPFDQLAIAGRKWFSVADGITSRVRALMDELYPEPSRYEPKVEKKQEPPKMVSQPKQEPAKQSFKPQNHRR